jgi:hypothetical protein
MLHFKYYIILLIGIFLALGLGILIGVTLENKDILENQQTLIAQQIEKEFAELRGETRQLKNNLSTMEMEKNESDSLCEYLFTQLVQDRLQGLQISLINMSQHDISSELVGLLRLTGASIESNITLQTGLYTEQADLEIVLETFIEQKKEQSKLYNIIAEEVLFSIMEGSSTPLLNRLGELRLISNSTNLRRNSHIAILTSNGRENKPPTLKDEYLDLTLIATALEMEFPIVAVEPGSVKQSSIPEYKRMGIPTVENVDTAYGKLELISLLEGNKASYKEETADNPVDGY